MSLFLSRSPIFFAIVSVIFSDILSLILSEGGVSAQKSLMESKENVRDKMTAQQSGNTDRTKMRTQRTNKSQREGLTEQEGVRENDCKQKLASASGGNERTKPQPNQRHRQIDVHYCRDGEGVDMSEQEHASRRCGYVQRRWARRCHVTKEVHMHDVMGMQAP